MPNRNAVDGLVTAQKAVIDNRQSNYHSTNQKYEQIKKGDLFDWVEVHEYVGPQGVGYTYILYATEQNKDYVKTIHHGPESRPNTNWTEIIEEII